MHHHSSPSPPLFLEGILILFSTISLAISVTYAIKIHRAPTWSRPPEVSWAQSGFGTLYYIPSTITLALALANSILYRKFAMPLVYAVTLSSIMCAGWITTVVFMIQCHLDNWGEDSTMCYQSSLRTGRRGYTYRRVPDSLANATMAFAVLIFLVYLLYVIVAAVDFKNDKKRARVSAPSSWGGGYSGRREKGGAGGAGAGFYDIGVGIGLGAGGGDGGGWGGGDGGGGGGDGGGGGGGDGGGGC